MNDQLASTRGIHRAMLYLNVFHQVRFVTRFVFAKRTMVRPLSCVRHIVPPEILLVLEFLPAHEAPVLLPCNQHRREIQLSERYESPRQRRGRIPVLILKMMSPGGECLRCQVTKS